MATARIKCSRDSKKSLTDKSRIHRIRRSIVKDYNEPNEKQYGDERFIFITQNEVNETTSFYRSEMDIGTHKINVTTRRLSIVGLRHYTQYQIWVRHLFIIHLTYLVFNIRVP